MLYICLAFLIVHYLLTFNVTQKLKNEIKLYPVKEKKKKNLKFNSFYLLALT